MNPMIRGYSNANEILKITLFNLEEDLELNDFVGNILKQTSSTINDPFSFETEKCLLTAIVLYVNNYVFVGKRNLHTGIYMLEEGLRTKAKK